MHCISHLACHDMYCIMLLVHCTVIYCGSLLVFLLWVEPGDEYMHEEPVEYANEDQAFDNSENLAGKMTIPSMSLLSLLASTRSIAMLALLAIVYHAYLLPCQTSNQPVLATVVWLCHHFCSAPLIVLLVAGEVEDCFMVDRIMLGYHNISYLINASIYLVKGGRLGIMPGVLFHSCRPSFRHIGIMFPDFAFLTRLGDLWDPLNSSL